jgi:hypothetical protein
MSREAAVHKTEDHRIRIVPPQVHLPDASMGWHTSTSPWPEDQLFEDKSWLAERPRDGARDEVLRILALSGWLQSSFHALLDDAIDGLELRVARHCISARDLRGSDQAAAPPQ